MCGIAGYSLRSSSDLERTLAAQALLAAIAERGADAVGYAYRAPHDTYATVVKQRTPASQLLDRGRGGSPGALPAAEAAEARAARGHAARAEGRRDRPQGALPARLRVRRGQPAADGARAAGAGRLPEPARGLGRLSDRPVRLDGGALF